jgi:mRNA interferase RelE/StbE
VTYTVVLLRAAERSLARLQSAERSAVARELRRLEIEPRHSGVRPVRSEPGWMRARVGDYRVVYLIDDQLRRILVKRIAPRDKAYPR